MTYSFSATLKMMAYEWLVLLILASGDKELPDVLRTISQKGSTKSLEKIKKALQKRIAALSQESREENPSLGQVSMAQQTGRKGPGRPRKRKGPGRPRKRPPPVLHGCRVTASSDVPILD